MGIIIITGASSGMGYEMCLQLDRIFQKIDEFWLIGRDMERLNELKNKIRNRAKCFSMDLMKDDSFRQFAEILAIEKPTIQMLVNGAGFGYMGNVLDIPSDDQAAMIRVNCEALTKMTTLCLPYMRKNSRIIQFASSAAFMPQAGFAVYAASKAYVWSYAKALGEELRKKKIYVTSVCPGPVDTNFFKRGEIYGKTLSIKKYFMAYPEDVVALAIKDSFHKKRTSVYGLPMKLMMGLTSIVPDKISMAAMRLVRVFEK